MGRIEYELVSTNGLITTETAEKAGIARARLHQFKNQRPEQAFVLCKKNLVLRKRFEDTLRYLYKK